MKRPKIVVGAPVAERAWILPRWFECLEAQTLRPTEYQFVISKSTDNTGGLILELGQKYHTKISMRGAGIPFFPRGERNSDPTDPWRAAHMAALRNLLREEFLRSDGDLFLSLDTDILFEDPTVLEQLHETIKFGWEVASPLTYLHPAGAISKCYNAGFFTDKAWGSFRQGWRRVEDHDLRVNPSPLDIEVPMAAFLARRRVFEQCRYRAHDCGEDIGFAQDLMKHKIRVGWHYDLQVPHIWDESFLEALK